jgi:hypothetical protein
VIRLEEPGGLGPKFKYGKLVVTAGATAALAQRDIAGAFVKHIFGNWGDVCAEDAAANDQAMVDGSRIVSVYHSAAGLKFYMITEADRSVTTVLLPEEY